MFGINKELLKITVSLMAMAMFMAFLLSLIPDVEPQCKSLTDVHIELIQERERYNFSVCMDKCLRMEHQGFLVSCANTTKGLCLRYCED